MISLSFSHIGFNSGILGKAVLASLIANLYQLQEYENLILNLNIILFSVLSIIIVSKQ